MREKCTVVAVMSENLFIDNGRLVRTSCFVVAAMIKVHPRIFAWLRCWGAEDESCTVYRRVIGASEREFRISTVPRRRYLCGSHLGRCPRIVAGLEAGCSGSRFGPRGG